MLPKCIKSTDVNVNYTPDTVINWYKLLKQIISNLLPYFYLLKAQCLLVILQCKADLHSIPSVHQIGDKISACSYTTSKQLQPGTMCGTVDFI